MEVRHIKNIILMIMKELGLADLLSPHSLHHFLSLFICDLATTWINILWSIQLGFFLLRSLSLSQYLYGFVLLCASPFFFMTKTQQQQE